MANRRNLLHDAAGDPDLRERFGESVLGPIFYGFCHTLHRQLLLLRSRAGEDGMAALFVSRAGLRLHELYQRFRAAQRLSALCPERMFYASRIAIAKACLLSDPAFVSHVIAREFPDASLEAMVRHLTDVGDTTVLHTTRATAASLLELLNQTSGPGWRLKAYLEAQRLLFREYLESLVDESVTTIALVDSGWTGNTQWMLMRSFPRYDWRGLYVGKWDYRGLTPAHFAFVDGLVIDASDPRKAHTSKAIVRHYHLIEEPLEPDCDSVQEYRRRGASVVPDAEEPDQRRLLGPPHGSHFAGILRYFDEAGPLSEQIVLARANRALLQLSRSILFPRPGDVAAMTVSERSADFGKRVHVPVLIAPSDGSHGSMARRLRASLWREGQLVLELPWLSQLIFPLRRLYWESVRLASASRAD